MSESVHSSKIRVCIRGGGDLASGVAWRLHRCGFRVYMTEIAMPMAVRRKVSFCEAVFEGTTVVEGVEGVCVSSPSEIPASWERGKVPVLVDPECKSRVLLSPEVLVDGILAKKNLGTHIHDAPLVIALGPGFEAGKDAHFVVETNRGHNLGRVLTEGSAEPDTGIPGSVQGVTSDRVLRAPAAGLWESRLEIGDKITKGTIVGYVDGQPAKARIDGILRGMIHPGIPVTEGLKIGDIDPRGKREYCYTISEKSLAIAGGVLEAVLRTYAR